MSKSYHPKSGSKFEERIEAGSNALGNFMCIVLAAIVIVWLCSDASQQVTQAVHHTYHANNTGFWPLDVVLDWL